MENMNDIIEQLDKMLAENEAKQQKAREEEQKAKEEAEKAREAKEAALEAKKKMDEAQIAINAAKEKTQVIKTVDVMVDEENTSKKNKKDKKEKKDKKNNGSIIRGIAAFTAGAMVTGIAGCVGYNIGKSSKSDSDKELVDDEDTNNIDKEHATLGYYDPEKNVYVFYDNDGNSIVVDDETITSGIENIATASEKLTDEKFEELVLDFTKICVDRKLNVSTEDIIKFVAVVNINRLAEENPELLQELCGTQTKEEFLSDGFKLVGAIFMYNHNYYNNNRSQVKNNENLDFIRVSDAMVDGEEKEKMLLIEKYIDSMVKVIELQPSDKFEDANGEVLTFYEITNEEEARIAYNELVNSFINQVQDPDGKLYGMDDGTGIAMQVYINMMLQTLSHSGAFQAELLNEENKDMLTLMTSAQEYISNIFTIYDTCKDEKKLTRTNN